MNSKHPKKRKREPKKMPRKPVEKPYYSNEEIITKLEERMRKGSEVSDAEKFSSVREELMGSPDFQDYPCRYCEKPDAMECGNVCDYWYMWFKLHWRRIQAEGKRIILNREIRKGKESLAQHHKNASDLYKQLSGGKSIFNKEEDREHDNG